MADAQVLTPDQVAQLLAAQQQSASTSSIPTSAPSQPRLKTSFKQTRSLPPFYTGGFVALHPSGTFLYSTLNDSVCVVQVSTGTVVQQFSPDTEEITALTVTPTGSHLVVASRSLALNVYSLPDCRLVRSVAKSHASQVNLMAVDPTGTLLATGGSDGVAKVWDLEGGFVTHAFKGNAGVVSALAWNMPPQTTPGAGAGAGKKKDKKKGEGSGRIIQLLTGSVDGKVRVWDLNNPAETNKPIATLAGHDSVVRGIAVTPDGATVVTGSRDRTLVIWRLPAVKSGIVQSAAGWKQSETLSANEGIEAVGFLPPSTFADPVFYTGGSSGSLRLWSLATSAIIAVQPKSFNENLAHLARQARIQRALASSSSSSRAIDLLDAEDEETRAITAVHLTSTPTGVNLVSVHADQNIVVRSVGASHAVQLQKLRQLIGFNDEIVDLAMLSASEVGEKVQETHLAVATNSRSLRVYTLGKEEETSVELLAGHTDIVLCLDRSPDLRLLASGAKDKSVRIWAYVPSSRLGSVMQEGGADDAGTKVSRSNGVEAVDAEGDGEWVCVGICEGHAESVGAIAFARRPSAPGSPYAPFIVSASQDRTVKIWDLSPLTTLLSPQSTTRITQPMHLKSLLTQRVHEKDINCLDVSPNNAMLATGSQDRTAKIFHLTFQPSKTSTATARLSPLATLKGHKRGIWACRFSPVDLALATSSGDKSIRLWSLKTFSTVKLFEGHTNSVLKLSFLSAGMQLASCAGDGLVKIWNVKEEECQTTIDAHDDKIWSFIVSQREERMVSAAADGTIKVWEDRTEEAKEEKRQEREDEVRMEQEFGNMLVEKDWRSAIGLALQMGQPRRLLGLFTHVSNSRPDEEGGKKNGLLASVLAGGDSDDDDEEEDGFEGLEQGDDRALEAAGIRTIRRTRGVSKAAAASQTSANYADANSITGLSSVDTILSTLPAPLLIQLLIYIRDWNTSTRTAPIAQTLLHAILSTHTASSLISMFESSSKSQRAALAERLENEELGIVETLPEKERARRRRLEKERNVDLGTLVEGLLPYTERHWQRADRVMIESSMLEYSVEAMDTLLGFDDDGEDEQEAEEGEGEGRTFGEQLGREGEGDVEMTSDDESA